MTATLYQPDQPPQPLAAGVFQLPDAAGRVRLTQAVADALGCALDMVDVLVRGPHFVVYTVFARSSPLNHAVVAPLFYLTGLVYGADQDEEVPQGNVLVVEREWTGEDQRATLSLFFQAFQYLVQGQLPAHEQVEQ